MHNSENRSGSFVRLLRNVALVLAFLILVGFVYYNIVAGISPPEIANQEAFQLNRENPSENYYTVGKNWLKKNSSGLWEMYVEGNPFEMGAISGILSKELILVQEEAFVQQINELIPSKFYLNFLRYFIGWFNRDLDKHIVEEYKQEIYGVSLSASNDFDYISDTYERILNYHAAHDIGHALKDLALVGCTSFAVNMHQGDSNMLIGRNFDFYINDKFARNKIVAFVNPESGYKFMYITWASMIGVVSGMNEHGLTVTINAAKSDIPAKSATPVSILAREILQYAKNFEEAQAIAEKRKIFVSESIFIGSATDQSAMIIEKSPEMIGFYFSGNTHLVCSNHFQSDVYSHDENNLLNIKTSASKYREDRCRQLIESGGIVGYLKTAEILRDHKGMNNANIGIGNEKTMAQMISHHSIIFQPEKRIVWVSTHPYQLGTYLAYDLNNIFSESHPFDSEGNLNDTSLTIPTDPFLNAQEYKDYVRFKDFRTKVKKHIEQKKRLLNEDEIIGDMINLNPEYYQSYIRAGDYYYAFNEMEKARKYYTIALSKEFENTSIKNIIEDKLNHIEKKGFIE